MNAEDNFFKTYNFMISVIILSCNNEKTIQATLDSVKLFSEVLLFDTGSKDKTLEIAKNYSNVKILSSTFIPFGKLRNIAASSATNDWILSIDSDEVLSKSLENEILNLPLKENTVYKIFRLNFYNGKQIKTCGWYPEKCIRLYNRNTTSFNTAFVHEGINITNHKVLELKYPLYHYPYEDVEAFLKKMSLYAALFAEENFLLKKSSIFKAVSHGVFHFLRSYLFRLGFIQGKEGFIISWYQGTSAFYKYLKLWEKGQNSKIVKN